MLIYGQTLFEAWRTWQPHCTSVFIVWISELLLLLLYSFGIRSFLSAKQMKMNTGQTHQSFEDQCCLVSQRSKYQAGRTENHYCNFYVSSVVSQMWPCICIINSQLTSVLNRRRNKTELWLAFSFKMGAVFMRSCFKEEPDILFKWHPFAAALDFCTRRDDQKCELFCKFRCLAIPDFADAGSPRSKAH